MATKKFNESKGMIEDNCNEYVLINKSLSNAEIEGGEIHNAIQKKLSLFKKRISYLKHQLTTQN